MFRSQTMLYYQLVMPRESAWDILNGLGELGAAQLIDYDPSLPMMRRPFAQYIKRCEDMLIQIKCVLKCVHQYRLPLRTTDDYKAVMGYFQVVEQKVIASKTSPGHLQLNDYEGYLSDRYKSIATQSEYLAKLNEQRDTLITFQKVLMLVKHNLGSMAQSTYFAPMVGVIVKRDRQLFERTLFRITKGNSFLNFYELDESSTIYILVTLHHSPLLNEKITRLCQSMSISQHEVPRDDLHYISMIDGSQSRIQEISQLIIFTNAELMKTLNELLFYNDEAKCSTIELIRFYVLKESELYHQLHRMRMQGSLFVGEMWIPASQIYLVEEMLQRLTRANLPSGQLQSSLPRDGQTPPTYFRLNTYTRWAQEIVNTYGVPRYREFNPGALTSITFPFLFGVMFGDIFHGGCLLIFALWLIWKKPTLVKQRDMRPLVSVRQMLLMMGFFSIYCGFIYNDYAGMSLNLFGSCYKLTSKHCTYQFGIDPAWGGSLAFVNSFKMKLSVIIAYLHMGLGITLMALNHRYNNNRLGIIAKFIPQILFLTCTFGYMNLLILVKWNTHWSPSDSPPSIINTMISMVLHFGAVQEGTQLYRFQGIIQVFLMIVAIACVPGMWYPHIAAARKQKCRIFTASFEVVSNNFLPVKAQEQKHYEQEGFEMKQIDLQNFEEPAAPHESLADVLVHESIETIEFVLGCVSNTASYLRLWALSLAHSQLAEVFYDLLLAGGVEDASVPTLLFLFPLWALVTGGVLLVMDSMECFLHALRLHWVEFQNKFYKGDGVLFVYEIDANKEPDL